ncbi:MAG: Uma2 family endonuclease [Gemmatimonadales bacterium]
MASDTATWTVAERDRLPDDGNRYEVIGGELFVTPAPSMRHQLIVNELFMLLDPFVREGRLGTVLARETEVSEGDDNVVVPDIAVYPFTRKTPPKSWADAPRPILVAEIRSSITWRRDIGPKRRLYLSLGIPEYWIVDPDQRALTVVRPDCADERVTGVVRWQPAGAASPFEVNLATLLR